MDLSDCLTRYYRDLIEQGQQEQASQEVYSDAKTALIFSTCTLAGAAAMGSLAYMTSGISQYVFIGMSALSAIQSYDMYKFSRYNTIIFDHLNNPNMEQGSQNWERECRSEIEGTFFIKKIQSS